MSYPFKAIYASPHTYTKGRSGKRIEYIFVHYTSNQGSARNNCLYFSRANRNASAHFFIDGTGTIYISVPEDSTAWAVGNFDLNQRSISIEVVSDGRDFTSAEIAELTWLVQHLMAKYGIPASRVYRHHDAARIATKGKTASAYKRCPAPYINESKWQALKAQITQGSTVAQGWIKNETGWWYKRQDASYPADKWEKINGKWYWFDTHGYMVTGWLKRGDTWYYLDDSGAMITGWKKINGSWYYLADSGAMLTGWQTIEGKKYYFAKAGGQMVTGWLTEGDKYYYADASKDGACIVDCLKEINGKVYAFDKTGAMLTGTVEVEADQTGALSIKAAD